ncbi:type II toxin-antitoxin system HigB family toxin [Algoriphagus winogradskyi]|uniref:mRNA interferase HigB n=1 Tax=Algoriphagus winogradskyi TaxID=237017 RepID=A0ABY1PJB8_9BACT|nr:type II toxin-antitoxin system HigB family toxin [Algoriphagus winogradskyi]SMP34014.1 mRNA interferase HigB [Algoriphagus winogradskyi]
MRIIARKTLREYWEIHNDCEQQLNAWYYEIAKSSYSSINDLKADYPSASILKEGRIVFNIKGNKYRLIVKFSFEHQRCWIRFIGTHAEYDKINANEI